VEPFEIKDADILARPSGIDFNADELAQTVWHSD
jgi:hypothetical protein